MAKNNPDLTIFGDYDIRGIYPDQLNKEIFYKLGRSIALYFNQQEVAVGYDARLSSPTLFKSLIRGLTDQGSSVVDLGLISTEMHYFASGKWGFAGNVIISASHNPPEYNGVKIVEKGVVPLSGDYGLPEIKQYFKQNQFPNPGKKGKIRKMKIIDQWIKHALSFAETKSFTDLKVVIDASNGMGGISWEKVMNKIPLEIVPLYFKPDGRFPNHLPDPLKRENIKDLQKKIIEENADLGFAIDGDADRLFVLDENGHTLSGTLTTALIADYLLKKTGPSPVLYNVVCGKIVPETITKNNGKPILVRVGHSFIKKYMKKYNGLFAGEHSGHFYFRDNFFADSSFISGLIMLEILSKGKKPLSQLIAPFDIYIQSSELNYKVSDVNNTIKTIENKFRDASDIFHIDGLTVKYKKWWFNLRASKTEPLLRLNVEADSKEILADNLKKVEKLILKKGGKKV